MYILDVDCQLIVIIRFITEFSPAAFTSKGMVEKLDLWVFKVEVLPYNTSLFFSYVNKHFKRTSEKEDGRQVGWLEVLTAESGKVA